MKDKEQDFLQDEPEIVQFVILESPQDGAVAGAMEGSQSRESHEHDRDLQVVADKAGR